METQTWVVYLFVIAVASVLAIELNGVDARLYYGRAIADEEFLSVQKTGYQDALTDPAGNKWAILTYLSVLASWVLAGALLGWLHIPAAVLATLVVVAVVRAMLPAPNDSKHLRRLYRSLCRRQADYARDGDHLRAEACAHVRERIEFRFSPDGTEASSDHSTWH